MLVGCGLKDELGHKQHKCAIANLKLLYWALWQWTIRLTIFYGIVYLDQQRICCIIHDNIIKDKVCYPDHPTQLGYMHKFLLVTLKRQPEACIGAQLQKDTFKDSLIFFFHNTLCPDTKLIKDFHLSNSIEHLQEIENQTFRAFKSLAVHDLYCTWIPSKLMLANKQITETLCNTFTLYFQAKIISINLQRELDVIHEMLNFLRKC